MKKNWLHQIFISYLGFIVCLVIAHFITQNLVLASACTGLLASFPPLSEENKCLIYAASFAAMNQRFLTELNPLYLLIPILVVLIFNGLKTKFIGYGGKLGTIAFISNTVVVGGLIWFIS